MKKVSEFFMKHKLSNVILLFLLLTVTFAGSFSTIFKVHYSELQGTHSWLSGSTIKFVNNWLLESPQKLHFVNFESPDSIEFNELTERGPYISYPSGCTLFVYIFAKLFGKTTIDINFLKHFQMCCFLLEVLLFGFFVYRFLEHVNVKSEREKIFISFATATFWSWLPTNVWYLANVYFADQCVILFVMAFLLVEYETYYCEKKSLLLALKTVKSILIFCGVLTDYYFWILAFVAFVLQIVLSVKSRKTVFAITKNSLWYAIPVVLAVGFFAYQLLSIPDWKNILFAKFRQRAGFVKTETGDGSFNTPKIIITKLLVNFITAFGYMGKNVFSFFGTVLYLLFLRVFPLFVLAFYLYSKRMYFKDTRASFFKIALSKNGAIIILGVLTPVLQILLLKNHSAIHEFSQIKLGWIFAMFPVVIATLICKRYDTVESTVSLGKIKTSRYLNVFTILFIYFILITGIPLSSRMFRKSRMQEFHDYHLAKILRDNTSYDYVCFSFSQEIPNNPPQELSVSRKRVYKISSKDEMASIFPNLKPDAVKIFVIDKNNKSNLIDEQIAVQLALQNSNKVFYEDERYCLLKIPSLDTSAKEDFQNAD